GAGRSVRPARVAPAGPGVAPAGDRGGRAARPSRPADRGGPGSCRGKRASPYVPVVRRGDREPMRIALLHDDSAGGRPARELADRRPTLCMLRRAVEETDAVTAAAGESRAALARWLALDVPVIEPHDAAGYERLYRELLARRT